MKKTLPDGSVLEGTPEELAEYESRTQPKVTVAPPTLDEASLEKILETFRTPRREPYQPVYHGPPIRIEYPPRGPDPLKITCDTKES